MNERISALMDGESSVTESAGDLARLKSSSELRRAWDTYHLIGDALRGQLAPGCAAQFARRLSAEPTVLAPRAPRYEGKLWMALSAAAGVAGFALVALLALQAPPPESGQLAIPNVPGSQEAAAAPAAVGLEDYVLAHLRYSNTSVMQGVAPYVRTVAEQREDGGR